MTPNDPFYASQWHFDLIGDIETIWDEFSGAGVSVVTYDDGVQYDHPDLDDNYDASKHFATRFKSFDPYPVDLGSDGHGTSVAGLIAAEANNGIGGVGVAHGVKLTGIDLFNDLAGESVSTELQAFEYGRNFDIMSNSWGYRPDFSSFLDLGTATSDTGKLLEAMQVAVEFGRGGLGTVITIAAGNDGLNAGGYGGVASQLTLAIGATNPSGQIENYSNWGPSVFMVAPSASHTTDITGAGGYQDTDETILFGGTSASTPIVSGVVALMLEAAPGLGWRDVRAILAQSAAQTGSAYGGVAEGAEMDAWRQNGADTWNGGGMSWHMNYGFGMVDAFAAVRMAEVWLDMHGPAQTLSNQRVVAASGPIATDMIDDFIPVSRGITITEDVDIEHVHVGILITHDDFHTLDIDLIAPDGRSIPLMLTDATPSRNLSLSPSITTFDYTMGVASLMGMSSVGTWQLRVEDQVVGGDGALVDFDLEFFGRETSVDDVHTFTQDFAMLQAADGDRNVVLDTNGGSDWLNFAAFAGQVNVRLDQDKVVIGGAKRVTIAEISEIENAVTGDGDDFLIGNALDNHLMGMRGADDLRGYQGRDTLVGGQGNDTLRGGADWDTVLGGEGDDVVLGGRARDRLEGGAGSDRLGGDSGTDRLSGGHGDDYLDGGGGRDRLMGNYGNDTLDGGGQNDKLFGGPGRDTFIFALNGANDTIMDFKDNIDTLWLDDALWGGGLSLGSVIDLADDSGDDVVFVFDLSTSLTLLNLADKSMLLDDLVIV